MEKLKKNKLLLVVAIVLMLFSMCGASLVQTSGGKVKVSEVTWVGTDGIQRTGLLLKPNTATAENPAPAVVCVHGFLNNKEMQDLNFVELARRGYVVLATDMPSHGDSEITPSVGNMIPTVWESALFLADVNYVDNTRIGCTGHSFGSFSCNFSAVSDNMSGRNLIAAILVNSMDPTVDGNSDGQFDNVYGARDVGVIAGQYDEFAFTILDANGNKLPKQDYIHSANAQSFLYFGEDPAGKEEREGNKVYTQTIDGKEAMRVIYTPHITHPWSHFSYRSTKATVEFFEQALGAPNPIPGTNQVWQWKTVFNIIGIVGFFMFAVNCAALLIAQPFFESVKLCEVGEAGELKGKKWWFWVSLVIGCAFGTLMYLPILLGTKSATYQPTFLNQSAVRGITVWAILCGLCTLVLLFVSKYINKDAQVDKEAVGMKISLVNVLKTIVLALAVVFFSFLWVYIADYFFHVDFRVWVFAIKRFTPNYLGIAIPFMILNCVFYIASSLSVNCFNRFKLGGKEWVNTLVMALFTGLPAIILVVLQYCYFLNTGFLLFSKGESGLFIVWLFPLIIFLPLSVVVARRIYKKTGNPYLAGMINAFTIALISCANTCTFI